MPVIRLASPADARAWLDLVHATLGADYPDKAVYDPAWAGCQLDPELESETWVAVSGADIDASVAILPPRRDNKNPIFNLGRVFIRPEAYANGSAEALFQKLASIAQEQRQTLVNRVLANDNAQQAFMERLGYHCVGFQPFKHLLRSREGVLFYLRITRQDALVRAPLSESLPQVQELIAAVLSNFNFPSPASLRDGAVGYPLQSELKFVEASYEEFELWRLENQSANPPAEISGSFNLGRGFLRISSDEPLRAILAVKEEKTVAGLVFAWDAVDRCFRFVQSAALDNLSIGAVFQAGVKLAQQKYSAVYVEIDVLVTAPRLLKSAEQLGFVPVAYFPAFYVRNDSFADVVKMMKLNMIYSFENQPMTAHSRAMAEIVDHNFQDQKIGMAIINLLRALPIFEGLGDGELRKVARLFSQKLFRANERIFNRGDSGKEAFIVMRGQIDIILEDNSPPIANIGSGQIFGEFAFLDGAARGAHAVAAQPSILLVVQRSAFNQLAQQEPHLGMVVMRNIAIELSNRLRKSNALIASAKK